MSRIAYWLEVLGRRRRAKRLAQPPLHVYYWTGAPSAPRQVQDISRTGAFIFTEDRWYPGTVMHLIFQHSDGTGVGEMASDYFGIWAKVVRREEMGLGVQFLWGDNRERKGFRRFIERISEKAAEEQMSSETSDAATLTESPVQAGAVVPGPECAAPPACEPGPGALPAPPPTDTAPSSDATAATNVSGPASKNGAGPLSPETPAASVEAVPADGTPAPNSRGGRSGSTLVEFAFVLLPLLALLFGAIEMDRMLLTYNAMANSARAGVRYAVVHGYYNPTTTSNIEQITRNFASMGLADASRATITVSYEDGTNHIGSPVSVSVAYPFDPLTSFFPLSVTLRSTAKGTITF